MQLFWGNFAFPVDGADVTSRPAVRLSAAGRPLRVVVALDVLAYLDGGGQKVAIRTKGAASTGSLMADGTGAAGPG